MKTRRSTPTNPVNGSTQYSRRQFLGRLGAGSAALGAAGIGLGVADAARALADHTSASATSPLVFGRIFPNLPAFAPPSDRLTEALLDIGKPGGILDADDDLGAGPVLLITDTSLSANNRNNPTHTAGTTFVGQFMDHDMTFDTSSTLGTPTEPTSSPNARTPTFDLDTVYGGGPSASPHLYDPRDASKLRIESGGLFEDLPRMADMTAIVGDPRNDENMIIAGLHGAFIMFHNKAVDHVRGKSSAKNSKAFNQARQLTTWHYHWMILHEFLPLFIGRSMVDEILSEGRRFYHPPLGEAFMPVEFQGACYRFGHSMVRPSYRANLQGDNGGAFFRDDLRPRGGGGESVRPERSDRGREGASTFHGVANLLRLRRWGGKAKQDDRPPHLHPVVRCTSPGHPRA